MKIYVHANAFDSVYTQDEIFERVLAPRRDDDKLYIYWDSKDGCNLFIRLEELDNTIDDILYRITDIESGDVELSYQNELDDLYDQLDKLEAERKALAKRSHSEADKFYDRIIRSREFRDWVESNYPDAWDYENARPNWKVYNKYFPYID